MKGKPLYISAEDSALHPIGFTEEQIIIDVLASTRRARGDRQSDAQARRLGSDAL